MVSVNPESASAPAPVTNNYPELKVDDNNDSVNNDKIELYYNSFNSHLQVFFIRR